MCMHSLDFLLTKHVLFDNLQPTSRKTIWSAAHHNRLDSCNAVRHITISGSRRTGLQNLSCLAHTITQPSTQHKLSHPANMDRTIIEVFQSIAEATSAATSNNRAASANKPPRASFQGLAPELRNNIYKYVAANEDRFVLGKRIVRPRKATESLTKHLHSAVALHPLAMTCRQMRDEFTGIHLAATEPRWVMVVNNFNLEQIEKFAEILDRSQSDRSYGDVTQNPGRFKIVDWQSHRGYLYKTPVYSPNIVLRFQMDQNAMRSVMRLRADVLKGNGTAPFPLYLNRYNRQKGGAFGVAEVATDCSPRHLAGVSSVKGLSFDEAINIQRLLFDLRNEVEDLRYNISQDEKFPDSFEYMQQCWFDPFFAAVSDMREVHKRVRRGKLFVSGLSLYACLCCL
jgi:hypothetical protein